VYGAIAFGNKASILDLFPPGGYIFSPASTPVEESRIFCYTVPGVLSITDGRDAVRGFTGYGLLTNLFKSISTNTVALEVDSTSGLENNADRATFFGNCLTPIIETINLTAPYPADATPENEGNIYLVGATPVTFIGNVSGISEDDGVMAISTVGWDDSSQNLTLDSLCTARSKLIPPINPTYLSADKVQLYYSRSATPPSSLIGVNSPEFNLWDQFKP